MSELVELLPAGSLPTEPGWYVCTDGKVRHICEVIRVGGVLSSYVVGNEVGGLVTNSDVWLARIYPERMEAAGGER